PLEFQKPVERRNVMLIAVDEPLPAPHGDCGAEKLLIETRRPGPRLNVRGPQERGDDEKHRRDERVESQAGRATAPRRSGTLDGCRLHDGCGFRCLRNVRPLLARGHGRKLPTATITRFCSSAVSEL